MTNEFLQYGGAMSEAIPARPMKNASNGAGSRGSAKARRLRTHASDWRPLSQGSAPRPPNLLILGASGQVAKAFLLRLQERRAEFGRLVLLDRDSRVLEDSWLDHQLLNYEFLQCGLFLPEDTAFYRRLLASRGIDAVLDLTDLNTLPVLEATDGAGVSYINTALNDSRRGVAEVLAAIHPNRKHPRRAAHIISSGMNPGVVNIWVWEAFQTYGAPKEIIHFEYDTSSPADGWRPMVTWSRQEFLTESVWERTGLVADGELRLLPGNALEHGQDMTSILAPVLPLARYPKGLLVLHEENVKLGQKLGASSKYLYAIHPRTMEYLERTWRERGRVGIEDLELGDNTSIPLTGSDTIGVCLNYPERSVYYLHSLDNAGISGTNATCAQVAVGAEAALNTLLVEPLAPRLYFASDLYDTAYRDFVMRHLRVDHVLLEKEKLSARPGHWQPGGRGLNPARRPEPRSARTTTCKIKT